jgi:hypothetical protein
MYLLNASGERKISKVEFKFLEALQISNYNILKKKITLKFLVTF